MASITRQLNSMLGEFIQDLMNEFVAEHNIELNSDYPDEADQLTTLFYESDEGKEVLRWVKQLPKDFDLE